MADGIHTETALVVDDGAVERLIGKAMLEKLGFSVTTAASGEQALLELQRQRYAVVLCDIGLPGMDGLAVVDFVGALRDPPIIITVSGHNEIFHALNSVRRGAWAQLSKPLHFDLLHETIATALAKQAAENASRHYPLDACLSSTALSALLDTSELSRRLARLLQNTRCESQDGALMVVRISGIHGFNRCHGRLAGNTVLQFAALVMSCLIHPGESLARLGGDLFALHLLPIMHPPHILPRTAPENLGANILTSTAGPGLIPRSGGRCTQGSVALENLFHGLPT